MKYSNVIIVLILVLIFKTANGQLLDNMIVKTRPFQDFVGFNPNIGIEKSVSNKLTVEIEYMYRNRTWHSNGGEWNFGTFHQSNGFRILTGFRKYMGRNKTSPFAWFFGLQLAYSHVKFKNLDEYTFHNDYDKTVIMTIKYPELILNIGRQFRLYKKLTFEFYLGPALYLSYYKKTEVVKSMEPEEVGDVVDEHYPFGEYGRFNFSWTIGYKF